MMGSGIDLDVLLASLKAADMRHDADGIAIVVARSRGSDGIHWSLHLVIRGELEKERFAYGHSPEDAYQRACGLVRDRLKQRADRARTAAASADRELEMMIPTKAPKP